MSFVLQYSFKRFWRKRGQILTTSFFLCLGFWGWLLSESTQTSIKHRLENSARQILTADLSIEVRREFSEQETEKINHVLQGQGEINTSYEFFAMLNSEHDSKLVLVRAIEDAYPFYGVLKLEDNSSTQTLQKDQIWAYREIKDLMELRLHENVKLGDAEFSVGDFVSEDQSQTFRLSSFAPSIFIHLNNLKKTNLLQFGSTFTALRLFKARPGIDIEALAKNLKKDLKDPGIDITTFKSLPDDMSGPTQRLSDFLGLTSLVSLLFCSLSLFYLLQIWASEQQREKAALAVFGLSTFKIQQIEFIQSILTAVLSTALSTILVVLSTPIVEASIREWFSADFTFRVTAREVSIILLCQIVLLGVLTFPFKKSSSALSSLLKDQMISNQKGVRHFMPLIFLIWPFAIFASRSWKNGSYFFLAIVSVCAALIGVGWLCLRGLRSVPWKKWTFSYATKALARQSTASWAFIVTVGVCSALLNLMPQIRSSIDSMMSLGQSGDRPSIFMFDIQQEQYPELQAFLKGKNLEVQAASPMIRARILKINDVAFERQEKTGNFVTREDETEARFKNRAVNLTYRTKLLGEEKIIKGEPFNMVYDSKQKFPFLSIEKSYFERLKLHLDDVVTFDVQGQEVSGQIKNVREVRWSRFEPNFFIVFQDGILNDAPQTYLAALPHLDPKPRTELMKAVSKKFANISMIDVERLIRDIVKNLERVSGALKLMTGLSFLTGILALIFLISSESLRRATEVHLLKVLGSQLTQILQTRTAEILILSLISLVVGLGASYVIAYFIIDKVFQVSFTPEFSTAAIVSCLVLGIGLVIGKLMTAASYRQNSFVFLKKEE